MTLQNQFSISSCITQACPGVWLEAVNKAVTQKAKHSCLTNSNVFMAEISKLFLSVNCSPCLYREDHIYKEAASRMTH